ncbi:hypothetical protein [Mycoplasmopsis verecunda]|uniref:Uncharacterized protein n=1 Tax=Mycoplasmopsis verecunda TaxID=171291 RepID=A0A1T4KFV0_9BACT|nr:hypothetical protein [Mycoplasmopsis verecunda]WPB54895.1 hypothetical protein SAM46_01925 [Mycoplasmopsis verecunda]SJZ41284.1 hypothetical protein SAMN02745154_00043 [Mycoplasmopsis verecunda]
MLTDKKFNNKNIICLEYIKRVDKTYTTQSQIPKYSHFIIRPFEDKRKQEELNKEMNQAKQQNIKFLMIK